MKNIVNSIIFIFVIIFGAGCDTMPAIPRFNPSSLFFPDNTSTTLISQTAKTSRMEVSYRSGQTFITWAENKDLKNEVYHIYRSSKPITEANLDQALELYQLPKGSSRFFANRYSMGGKEPKWLERYVKRYVINDNAEQLPENTGLLVWTLSKEDMGGADQQTAYYAITIEPEGENATFEPDYSLGPILEKIEAPAPVEIKTAAGEGGHVYIQYMDLHSFNPTFYAPNDVTGYYGLDPNDYPIFSDTIQYGLDYAVSEPDPNNCGGKIPQKAPLLVNLHGWKSNVYRPYTEGYTKKWCAYMLYPLDISETWWFGFARNHDYRKGKKPVKGDTIVNYTEQRVLRMISDLERNPPGPEIDQNRIYIYGHSMGGSGSLAFAMRYPNIFAAAYASKPMTNYITSGNAGGNNWRNFVVYRWGNPETNIPIQIDAPNGWADNLKEYDGTSIWDWQNHQNNLVKNMRDQIVPIGIGHSLGDIIIEFETQGQPVYGQFNSSRQNWAGVITNDKHNTLNFSGMPAAMRMDSDSIPFDGLKVVKDESIPGFSNASKGLKYPPEGVGVYNQFILWSSSWFPWDGAPIDTPNLWQISLCWTETSETMTGCSTGHPYQVDITPRRLQQFLINPGSKYLWENRTIKDNSLVESGTVIADKYGLVTIQHFRVASAGSRLVLKPSPVLK